MIFATIYLCLYYWIVVVVELSCLDEGRSLYSVDCCVATTGISIICDFCVCLLLLSLFLLDYCIVYIYS